MEGLITFNVSISNSRREEYFTAKIDFFDQVFYATYADIGSLKSLLIGRGDNLQLFISPLLKYEGSLYNIIDDKNFEINSWEPPVQGVWKFHIHPAMGTCRNAKN